MLDILAVHSSNPDASWLVVLFASLLSLVLAGLVAWTYGITFHGLSFSRNFVQSMILVSLVSATIMQAVGESIARGLGMMGALAVVRFRTNFTDPKDLIFLFAAIAAGIGCGIYAWSISIIGSVAFCLAAFLLYKADIGSHSAFDGLLRFTAQSPDQAQAGIEKALRTHLRHFALISLREVAGGTSLEYAYQIKFRRGHAASPLLAELSAVPSLVGLHFMMQESTTEL